jgi:hypothetical protein
MVVFRLTSARSQALGRTELTYMKDQQSLLQVMFKIEWILWQNSTVDGMIVRGLLKHESSCVRESSCVGMKEHISMGIASVDGKCYDSTRACGGSN